MHALPLPGSGGSRHSVAWESITAISASMITVSLIRMSFPLCLCYLPLPHSFKATLMAFRAHPDNPGQSPLPKILNLITSAKPSFQSLR